jgi:hypothetical protein
MNKRACSSAALVSGAALAFQMHQRVHQINLKLDLLATQLGSGGQGRNLVEGTGEMSRRFRQC